MKSEFERYEQYATVKCRPGVEPKAAEGRELAIITNEQPLEENKLCLVYPKLPENEAEAIKALEAAAKKGADGVVLNLSGHKSFEKLCKAAESLIAPKQRVATVKDAKTALLPFMKNARLLLEGEEIYIRETLARTGLSKRYEKADVYLDAAGNEKLLKCAEGWHVYAAVGTSLLGPGIALRRITYPKQLSSKGAFPVRVWLQNTGTCAERSTLKIKFLIKEHGKNKEIKLKSTIKGLCIGDETVNEIAALPNIKAGEYPLFCGVFINGRPVKLANAGLCSNGYCEIGKISVDNEIRNELFTAWQSYYPEGYYPLEDPKLPN